MAALETQKEEPGGPGGEERRTLHTKMSTSHVIIIGLGGEGRGGWTEHRKTTPRYGGRVDPKLA